MKRTKGAAVSDGPPERGISSNPRGAVIFVGFSGGAAFHPDKAVDSPYVPPVQCPRLQAHQNPRLERSLIDKGNHSVCHFCPGPRRPPLAVIIPPEGRGFRTRFPGCGLTDMLTHGRRYRHFLPGPQRVLQAFRDGIPIALLGDGRIGNWRWSSTRYRYLVSLGWSPRVPDCEHAAMTSRPQRNWPQSSLWYVASRSRSCWRCTGPRRRSPYSRPRPITARVGPR
jgi:hypothetical protein